MIKNYYKLQKKLKNTRVRFQNLIRKTQNEQIESLFPKINPDQ